MKEGRRSAGAAPPIFFLFFFRLNFSPSPQITPYLCPTFLHRRAFRVLLSFLPKFRHGEVGYMTVICEHEGLRIWVLELLLCRGLAVEQSLVLGNAGEQFS